MLSDSSSSDSEDDVIAATIAKRRRILIVCALLAADVAQIGPTGPNRLLPPAPFHWMRHLGLLTEKQFKLRYRIDIASFNNLLSMILPSIQIVNKQQAQNSRHGVGEVVPEVRLALCLRYLAGGQVLDLILVYTPISEATVYKMIWLCVDAINDCIKIEYPLSGSAADNTRVAHIEQGFRMVSPQQWLKNCGGALDGIIVPQKNPGKAVKNPKRYYVERKNTYGILCIAVADSERRFISIDMTVDPMSHDSMAFDSSVLATNIKTGRFPSNIFLIADSAFTCSRTVVTPGNDVSFNYFLSSARMAIECAFSILIRRWGIFWRALEMAFDKRTAVTGCCMRLHNYCIDRKIMEVAYDKIGDTCLIQPNDNEHGWVKTPRFDEDGRPLDFLDTASAGERGEAGKKSDKSRRIELEKKVRDLNLQRPRKD